MSSEWKDGLPPVGAVVEFRDHGVGGALVAHIVAHHVNGKEAIWSECADDGELNYGSAGEFRPIRSEREKAVAEMLEAVGCTHDDYSRQMAERIYDAGYRKTEGV